MMRTMWLAGAGLFMASAAQAGDRAELGCMESGYTSEQTAQIDALLPMVDVLGSDAVSSMDTLGMVVGAAAFTCAETLEWSEEEFEPAILFELGRLMELAGRRHGPLLQDDVAKVDAALAKGDRTALWLAIEEQIGIGMSGEDTPLSDENAKLFENFITEVGLELSDQKGEQVGAFLAAMAMQTASARRFAAQ